MALKRRHNSEEKDRTSKLLLVIYIIFLLLSGWLILQIINLKFIWEPDPKLVNFVRPIEQGEKITAIRGSITDCNGKPLSISIPRYEIRMDCTVRKEEYRNDKEEGEEHELEWRQKARELSKGLSRILGKKSANEYARKILGGRDKGAKYVLIARNVDFNTLKELKKLPLFNEKSYRGGMIVRTDYDNRQYPYGALAKQAIGEPGNRKGIEHSFDHILRGKDGFVWKRVIDNKDKIVDNDSTLVPVQHGKDIRTTLDINMQDVCDRALRRQIEDDEKINGGCLVLMEVKTGAIKSMVNLSRNRSGKLEETINQVLTNAGEPGSVIKTAALTALLEDKKAKLSTVLETNDGRIPNMNAWPVDQHIRKYEDQNKTKEISLLKGFQMSSNYVLGRSVKEAYSENPNDYIDKLDTYLKNNWTFELGCVPATLPTKVKEGRHDNYMLASAAVGYSTMVTPLHLLVFYNAIARGGVMVKPYIVDSFEEGETVIEKFKPQELGRICSEQTADSVRFALRKVVADGTGYNLKKARQAVAGKTGTARIAFPENERISKKEAYVNKKGEKKFRATFVGYFPAEKPLYSVICVIFSEPGKGTVYGGTKPAKAIDEVIERLYALDDKWGDTIKESGVVPEMQTIYIPDLVEGESKVPDIRGLGLDEAIFAIENCGYKCQYSGYGHVHKQYPEGGTNFHKGQIVKIELR